MERLLLPPRIVLPVQQFLQTEASGGIVLLTAAVVALAWANSPVKDAYSDLWGSKITIDLAIFDATRDLKHWVNEGLMVVFFFVVGLEIKRELLFGELAGAKRAALPVAAAIGGMIAPALLYTAVNAGHPGAHGWGVPMATDIAFAVGVLTLLGDRVPSGLRAFILALAIVDDIGAIVVIALFYGGSLDWTALAAAAGIIVLILAMQRARIVNRGAYVLAGVALWAAVFHSGIHATIAGVALGLLTPARPLMPQTEFPESARDLVVEYQDAVAEDERERAEAVLAEIEEEAAQRSSPLERLERILHPWSSFVAIPVFALANAGVDLSGGILGDSLTSRVTLGVVAGLLAGKLAGVLGASFVAVKLRLGELPGGATWTDMAGLALLAGIGFTVALFIAGLAFDDPRLADEARIGVFAASMLAGAAGFVFLRFVGARQVVGAPEAVR